MASISSAWREALRDFGVNEDGILVRFVLINLARQEVRAIGNARLRQGIEVKESDSRSTSYIAQDGDRCWEADILLGTTIE